MRKLEKIELNAIRKADTLVIRHVGDRMARIECIKKPTHKEKENNPYADEKRYYIEGVSDSLRDEHEACEVISCYEWSGDAIETMRYFLKAGDGIWLDWRIDAHQNDYMRKNNLHGDVLYLKISRTSKAGKTRTFSFLLESQVCENNSARMIKSKGAQLLYAA